MNTTENLRIQIALDARDATMRETLPARKAFYKTLARLASCTLRLLEAFEQVDALKPGENDYGQRSILNHYPEIIESAKNALRTDSAAAFGTLDYGAAIAADTYDAADFLGFSTSGLTHVSNRQMDPLQLCMPAAHIAAGIASNREHAPKQDGALQSLRHGS
jgi:hypothetical protein